MRPRNSSGNLIVHDAAITCVYTLTRKQLKYEKSWNRDDLLFVSDVHRANRQQNEYWELRDQESVGICVRVGWTTNRSCMCLSYL